MTYKPTGRPPGRPSKSPSGNKEVPDTRAMLKETTVDRANRPMSAWCPECFPEGFPVGQSALHCTHGLWVRRF